MKKSLLLSVIVLLGALMVAPDVDAQRKYKRRKSKNKKISNYRGSKRKSGSFGRFRPYMWAGGGINAGNYFGDLAPVNKAASTDISFTRPGFGGVFGYRLNPYMSARANFNWVRVSGSDFSADPTDETASLRYQRNLSFRNDIFELIGGFEIDILPNKGGSNSRVPMTPYIFIGGGVFMHNPKGKVPIYNTFHSEYNFIDPLSSPASAQFSNAGDWVSLRDLGTEGQNVTGTGLEPYATFSYSVPIAVGFKLRLPDQFDAAIEFGYRHLFIDYIDDASSRDYLDPTLFDSDLTRAMADRSREHIDAITGDERVVIPGYYYSVAQEIRGNPDDNDKIFVTQIRLTYIFGGVKRKAKFR